MPFTLKRSLTVIAIVLMLGVPRLARALTACTSAQIIAQDSSCPGGTGACSITKNFVIANGCTLDFGTRAVTLTSSGTLDINSGFVTIKAGSFTVAAGGFIDGRGTGNPPLDRGGSLLIKTTGNFAIQKVSANGRVEVSGDTLGGTVVLDVGGSIQVAGTLLANSLTATGEGGNLYIQSRGDFVSLGTAQISVAGGSTGLGGGVFDLNAGGKVDLGATLNASGYDGGIVEITAGTTATIRKIDSEANGDSGDGGCVNVVAGTTLSALDDLLVSGNASNTESGGGDGGFICLEAQFGNVTAATGVDIEARGEFPEGGGGALLVLARGSITVPAGATMSARGNGTESCGGEICVEAELDVTVGGAVDGSGGGGGGDVDVGARRNVTISGNVDATGRSSGGLGGSATVEAGRVGRGNLSLSGILDASGGDCGVEMGCGLGGFTDVSGCDVTITSTGKLLAQGADAGDNCLRAREQLRVQGVVLATAESPMGQNGTNSITFKTIKPPIITGTISPGGTLTALPPCTAVTTVPCMLPCPTCGNGIVEYPETCDNSNGTPASCDGCSAFCQTENCNDNNVCTADSCDPTLGCRNVPATTPCFSGPTPTPTRTPTLGPTFTRSNTPTRTPTRTTTKTATITQTPSLTPTRTTTRTPSRTATRTNTATPPATPPPTNTATKTATQTPTRTPTDSPTAVPALCNNGVDLGGPFIKLTHLGAPTGDEKMLIKGTMAFLAGTPATFDPETTGAQVRVEDVGTGNTAIFDLTADTVPVPPGAEGSGCGRTDGWKTNAPRTKQIYKNRSGAFPPTCAAGSADGLYLLKLKDQRATAQGIQLRVKAKDGSIPKPVGPLRITVVLGTSAANSANGDCAMATFDASSCTYNSAGTTLLCH